MFEYNICSKSFSYIYYIITYYVLTRMYPVLVHANTLETRLPANTSFPNYGYVVDFPRL